MKKRPTVVAEAILLFDEELRGRPLVVVSVGPQLDLVILSLSTPPDFQRPGFAKQYSDQINQYRIHVQSGDQWLELSLPPTRELYHYVQPLPESNWLLVRGRAENDQDANAHVFDDVGRLLRSFPAGDGIQDVQTDESGQIWISYFDEGVFGDTSLGRNGLVCLDDSGKLLFDFQRIPHECVRSMADCYALNVCSAHEAWLCYYTDFPLVKLADFGLANVWLRQPISGSPAFAVLDDSVLFAGGYRKRDSLFLVNLGSLRSKEMLPVDPAGTRIRKFSAFARRSVMFLATNEALFRIDGDRI
jgi:hypothetical protein